MTKNSTWSWNQAEDLEPQHQILGHEWAGHCSSPHKFTQCEVTRTLTPLTNRLPLQYMEAAFF